MDFRTASLGFVFAFAALPGLAQNPPTVQSLASDLAALTARLAKLEGQIVAADLVGSYTLTGFQIELSGGAGRAPQVASYVFAGTFTLNADGAASFIALSENGNTLAITVPPSVSIFKGNGGGSGNGTWTYANGSITFDGG